MNIGNASRKRRGYTLDMAIDTSMPRTPRQCVPPCITDVRVRSKVWLEVRGEFAIGQGGIELLARVAQQGSLARAARDVGWSYRHAWGYVRHAESVLGVRLLSTKSGKGAARGMALTPAAEQLVNWFDGVNGLDRS
jgi:molybdate transport system regulatory protein